MDGLTYHNCGWLGTLRFFDKSDNEVLDLPTIHQNTFCPAFHPPRLSQEQRGLLDAVLTDLGEGVQPTLASYYTPAAGPAPDVHELG